MDVERSRRFQRFIKQHVDVFAELAQHAFTSRGRGAIHLVVDTLEGGEEFRPQTKLSLTYVPEAEIKSDAVLADVIQRCEFPEESVVVASYRDGTREITRVQLQKMRQSAGLKPGQGQWTPERGMQP